MNRRRRLGATAVVAGAVLLILVLLLRSCAPPATVTVVAAGDMACAMNDPDYGGGSGAHGNCQAKAVSDLAVALHPVALLGLGDYQFELPTADAYATAYGKTWGRLRSVTIPARGNQEYKVHDANTFTDYFGTQAGDEAGYWSTDVGAWHVVVLDSNCTTVFAGCSKGSSEQKWLAADLASNGSRCTVALMHHPRWSSGIAGDNQGVDALWRTLASNGVDLLLSGHEADYERFPPLSATGEPDQHGLTEMVVGTGGQAHYRPETGGAGWRKRVVAHRSTFVDYDHHAVLALTLRPDGWSSALHTVGGGVEDSHTGTCS